MKHRQRSTPPGQHRPVLLDEVLAVLEPRPGAVFADCTVGWGGHAAAILARLGPTGRLIGTDLDPDNLPRARARLETLGLPFALYHSNFAALPSLLAAAGVTGLDGLVADLGMSSMQVNDAGRGFSYARDGPLDMRMDQTRGRSAAQVLATISQADLAQALRQLGDEPDADRIAAAIVTARQQGELLRTTDLVRVIQQAAPGGNAKPWRLHPAPGRWNLHPAAHTFRRCASWSTASWPTWNSCCACCRTCCCRADVPPLSAFTAARTAWSRRPSVTANAPGYTRPSRRRRSAPASPNARATRAARLGQAALGCPYASEGNARRA